MLEKCLGMKYVTDRWKLIGDRAFMRMYDVLYYYVNKEEEKTRGDERVEGGLQFVRSQRLRSTAVS